MKNKRSGKKPPSSKRSKAAKNCFCQVNPALFKSRPLKPEILQIQGISDVSLMGNDSTAELKSSKVLLAALGPKFKRLLNDTMVKLDFPFEVVQVIHDFSLSGVCNLTNLQAILLAANELNIIGIKVQAGLHLVAATNIENALEMLNLSEELCAHTRRKVKEFILNNFEELGDNHDFIRNCKPAWMSDFIKEDTLNTSEENVFKILVNWAQQSKENEQAFIQQISKDIRFELMDRAFFNAEVKTCPFLQNSTHVQAADKLLQNIPKKLGRPRKDRTRVPLELVFAVGHKTTVQVFNLRANRWYTPTKSAFPDKSKELQFFGVAAVDGKLVAFGRHHAYTLDLSTHKWTQSAKLDRSLTGRAFAELGGKIYCIGRGMDCFDPNLNEWKNVKSMNDPSRLVAAAVAYNNTIIVLGGEHYDATTDTESTLNSIEKYDPALDEWTPGPRMNTPRQEHKAVILNSKLYVIGGWNMNDITFPRTVETLDLEDPNAIWSTSNELIHTGYEIGATVVNKKIMIASGFHSFWPLPEFFSEETNQWTTNSTQPIQRRKYAELLLRGQEWFVTVEGLPNRKSYTM